MRPVTSLPPIVEGRPLDLGAADLWCFFHEGVSLARYETLLTDDERARRDRLRFQCDRDEFTATRALVRTVLSRYADVPPSAWRFAADEHGKPTCVDRSISFNLTNTRGLVACVVGGSSRIGVDAERIEPKGDLAAVARRFFAPAEIEAATDVERFYAIWTLKESYLKARGAGLGLPLQSFSFDLEGPEPLIRFHGLDDDPARWRFALLRASPDHVIAVAAESAGEPLVLHGSLHGIVPL